MVHTRSTYSTEKTTVAACSAIENAVEYRLRIGSTVSSTTAITLTMMSAASSTLKRRAALLVCDGSSSNQRLSRQRRVVLSVWGKRHTFLADPVDDVSLTSRHIFERCCYFERCSYAPRVPPEGRPSAFLICAP